MPSQRSRPKKHFTPKNNWINDPNGLIYHGGNYHLFFQHNPYENKWGHMSWGHATSKDLINWTELNIAIPEQPDHAIFSGSAVFDAANNRLVAIYSGHREGNQSQYLSYSYDGGATWQENIKVLDLNMADFRDPKVFKYQDHWVMVVAKSKELKVSLFESKDLLNWNFLSDFVVEGINDIYECPDLFELDGKWVLILSTNPGGLHGGSGSRYVIGNFDGKEFVAETKAKFLDFGPDYYAAVSFNDTKERKTIGWFNNWIYANDLIRETWNGSMSAVRKLRVVNNELVQEFIGATEKYVVTEKEFEFKYINGAVKFKRDGDHLNIDRSELWDSTISSFPVPAVGPLNIEALFDAGSLELAINGQFVSMQLLVGDDLPVLSVNNY